MDSHDYGHHASGYRKADGGPSKRFMRHLTVLAVVLVACLVWVMTRHAATRWETASVRWSLSLACPFA